MLEDIKVKTCDENEARENPKMFVVGIGPGCADISPMPLALVVKELSDDDEPLAPEGQVAVVKAVPQPKPQGRKRVREAVEAKATNLASDKHVRSLLGRQCRCKKCLSQFVPNGAFNELKEYLTHWHDLHKLDQDQFVALRNQDHFSSDVT